MGEKKDLLPEFLQVLSENPFKMMLERKTIN
jgi:hypothetical protein